MDLLLPPPPCISFIDRTQPLFLRRCSSSSGTPSSRLSKYRRRVSSEFQTTSVGSGNGRVSSYSPSVPTYKVTVNDRQRGVVHEFLVPEDQYILHTAEAQNITLPFACRHDSTLFTVDWEKIVDRLRLSRFFSYCGSLMVFYECNGYALLCVGFPSSDLEVETQDEDEVYWLQFGRYFARGPIERDDYALELAMADE
ncbi:hypothetical protein CDL15_Pgr016856 [Punica granatum]|uniref:Uncharacterized protein n=1 Tax=Punica granatum TaxID=22663 RepID=A0A218WY76_PUNGR|nr:hypothetical protein CDL15_Pgr016856 [Punica granatum]